MFAVRLCKHLHLPRLQTLIFLSVTVSLVTTNLLFLFLRESETGRQLKLNASILRRMIFKGSQNARYGERITEASQNSGHSYANFEAYQNSHGRLEARYSGSNLDNRLSEAGQHGYRILEASQNFSSRLFEVARYNLSYGNEALESSHTFSYASSSIGCLDEVMHGIRGVSCKPSPKSRGLSLAYTVNVSYGDLMLAGLHNANLLLGEIRVDLIRSNSASAKPDDAPNPVSRGNITSDAVAKRRRVKKVSIDQEFWGGSRQEAFRNVRKVRIQFVGKPGIEASSPDSFYIQRLYTHSLTDELCHNVKNGLHSNLNKKQKKMLCKNVTDYRSNFKPIKEEKAATRAHSSHIFIVPNAGFDDTVEVRAGIFANGHFLMTDYCDKATSTALDSVSFNSSLPFHREVFAVPLRLWSAYFHCTIDKLSGLALYVDFLRANPSIRIHLAAPSRIQELLQLLDIDPRRLVVGKFRAGIVYMPRGGGCGGVGTCALCRQSLWQLLRNVNTTEPETGVSNPQPTEKPKAAAQFLPRNVVLLKRSKQRVANFTYQIRYLVNHRDVDELLSKIASEFQLNYVVYSDRSLPSMRRTIEIFRNAVLIVAPHGAGLANIIFAPNGTFVVEVLKQRYMRMTFKNLAYHLGQRYFGMISLTPAHAMKADVKLLSKVARAALQHWRDTDNVLFVGGGVVGRLGAGATLPLIWIQTILVLLMFNLPSLL